MGTVSDIKLIRTDLLTLLIKKLPQRDIAPLGYYKNSRLGRAPNIYFIAGDTGPPRMGTTTKGWGASPPAWASHNNYTSPVRRPGRYIITVVPLLPRDITDNWSKNKSPGGARAV